MSSSFSIEQKSVTQEKAKEFLFNMLSLRINGPAQMWLDRTVKELQTLTNENSFYLAFSAASRYSSKQKIQLNHTELEEANSILRDWNIANWTTEQCVRVLLILLVNKKDPEEFKRILNKQFSAADVDELVALYAALPLFPFAEHFTERASEGIRNNITPVFDAVALNNPYPSQYLSDEAWNQLVLKAIFNNRPVHKIIGLGKRCNQTLTNMLVDFAHERWAAGRSFTPQLWRCAGSFLNEGNLDDIQKVLKSDSLYEQLAATLACANSNSKRLHELIEKKTVYSEIQNGSLSWQTLVSAFEPEC
jgi:hypothetical protein